LNILPDGHEAMFATNVMGPFLLTRLLLPRLEQNDGMILHVIAPFNEPIDWDDLESIINHKTFRAFKRTKTCHRAIAGELARRYAGKISSVAFDPTFIKPSPGVDKKWPSGLMGFALRTMSVFFAKAPAFAGEPAADLIMSQNDRSAINGALFKLDKRMPEPDPAMTDEVFGKRLWEELERITQNPAVANVETY
jgi:NAD(P)-dependent dehydrogenase (short-subunit alcohol dehydrogenase family)